MPTTNQLTITLRPDLVKIVQAKVSSGEYASLDEFVGAAIELAILDDIFPVSDTDLDVGIVNESVRRYDAMVADPSQCMTHEEFWAEMEADEEREGKEQ
jgi:Arc/MetJ-type ribon-helix-helix transcriptional regulator